MVPLSRESGRENRRFSNKNMIDTVLLEVQKENIPDDLLLFKDAMQSDGFLRRYCNPDAKFVRSFGYTPSYTIKKQYDPRQDTWTLQGITIHASLPKLLYGTNYYGVDETDYEALIDRLVERSNFVGLPFDRDDIENATLKQVDFCFNFVFPDDYASPIEYLKRMVGLDAGKVFSGLKHKGYVQTVEGFSLGIFNGRVGVSFYDKQLQLRNQAKTREETMTLVNMDLRRLPRKVLRMEVRWQNQRAVKQHLYTYLRGEKNQTRYLHEVFDNALVQDILGKIFKKITDNVNIQSLQMPIVSIENTLEMCETAKVPLYDSFALIGQAYAMQSLGANNFKKLQDQYYSRQTRSNTRKRFEHLLDSYPLPTSDLATIFGYCREQLEKFDILKPSVSEELSEKVEYGKLLFAG